MALTKQFVRIIALAAAQETETEPRNMDQHCMDVSEKVFMQIGNIGEVQKYLMALRFLSPDGGKRSHVAVLLTDENKSYIVDASWQQYQYVDKRFKYHSSNRKIHTSLSTAQRTSRANEKAKKGDRVYVATPDDWIKLVAKFNSVKPVEISSERFQVRAEASAWMSA